jgi:5-methylcytosine-specific restriction protein B
MNLARVEHYFADFLSAMESGEPIHLHDRGALEPDDEESLEVPKQIRIPANLFITGTVNVDETTHMFSPKVLDRSFVIEFNEVDLEGHGSSIAGPDDLEAIGFKSLWNSEPPKSSDWAELAAIHDGQVRAAIVELHEILADENRHFGYRVANEIARYLELAGQQAGNDLQTTWTALDFAIFSKVLPKLHGTTQELRAILLKLFAFCVGQPAEVSKWKVESGQVEAVDGSAKARYPRSAAKLHRMVRRLTSRGFTSFIE